MKCPFCAHLDDKVIDSRAAGTGEVIRRRRECEGCNRRFTTYERVEDVLPTVVKKDGRREPFDRQKLVRGLRTACNKRPVAVERIELIADAVEREVQETESREVTASQLGEHVMAHLRELDEVAYVRFASVYRSFRDAEEFLRELGKLVDRAGQDAPPLGPDVAPVVQPQPEPPAQTANGASSSDAGQGESHREASPRELQREARDS